VRRPDFGQKRKPLLNVFAVLVKLLALIPRIVNIWSVRDAGSSPAAVLPVAVVHDRIVVDEVPSEELFSMTPIHVQDFRQKIS